jgi:glycosyltransferase involved in cell wall biosynthesis
VPLNDHAALAAQAMRLLEEEGLAVRLARNGRASSRAYAWPTVRAEWLDAYQELAGVEPTRSVAAAT